LDLTETDDEGKRRTELLQDLFQWQILFPLFASIISCADDRLKMVILLLQ
jgi:hypothetical protein